LIAILKEDINFKAILEDKEYEKLVNVVVITHKYEMKLFINGMNICREIISHINLKNVKMLMRIT